MDRLIVSGPSKLEGIIEVSGAKNAALPILFATLLNPGKTRLGNVPKLRDITTTIKLLENLGASIETTDNTVVIDGSSIDVYEATYDLVKTMRASILTLGPLLGRFGKAKVSLPGGCAIGARPIDIHLKGMEALGAIIELKAGYVEASAPTGLKGTDLILSFPSVGATENIMMAATYATGTTIIQNAAKEPEIVDLANFLMAMGVTIRGAGTSTIEIDGVEKFNDCSYQVLPDRIEAATFIIAGLISNSHLVVDKMRPDHLTAVLVLLKEMGARLDIEEDKVIIHPHDGLKGINFDTAPYPGFPTDVQAQMMTLCLFANTSSVITETIFENRFMHVPELQRMGADIELKGNTAIVKPSSKLTGAPVMCTDLRASASLILAALMAQGETQVQRIYHLDRGYENIEAKLSKLGASIKRSNPGEFL